jgi:hypothetical protein
MQARLLIRGAAVALLVLASAAQAQVTLSQGTNFSVDAAVDGRLAIDLLGGIWIVPPRGGSSSAINLGLLPARRPRWSPDASAIVYQARAGNQDHLWLYDFADETARNISDGQYFDQHPEWHPDGNRIIFSSDRADTGFDLWETDLPSQLSWRISHQVGDESEPAWSADGRDLVYIHHFDEQWSVMLRRLGRTDETLVTSSTQLSSPSWRPDGSLVTFLRHDDKGLSIDMIILSEPILVRELISNEDFFVAPVAWLDRQQMFYTADGVIRKRPFNSWKSTTVPFRATVRKEAPPLAVARVQRELAAFDVPDSLLVIRVARLFDGLSATYRQKQDIVIHDGKISAIEDQRERPGTVVLNLGNLTALPGFIDSYAALPDEVDEMLGPLLLSYGVTTVVAENDQASALNERWSGKVVPGPRVLAAKDLFDLQTGDAAPWLITISGDITVGTDSRDSVTNWQSSGVPVLAENWQVGIGSGASMLLGVDAAPASPSGQRYNDIQLSNGSRPVTIVSGLADARTPDLAQLLQSRQAQYLPPHDPLVRRFSAQPQLSKSSATIVLGSKPNGLPPGIALHAEFRALEQAGLKTVQILRATGTNASRALGLGSRLGRLIVGGEADMVLVHGDPLADITDTRKIAGVVRNGRFFSINGLVERAANSGN